MLRQKTMDQVRPVRKSSLSPSAATAAIAAALSVVASGGRQLQLPPLISTSSDNEREAHIRNRHEQIRLNKLLDHIDVQERVFVQLFNKERHVIETTMTHVASTASLLSSTTAAATARCRHHRYQYRAQQQRQQQHQIRLRWAASAANGSAVGGGPVSVSATVTAVVAKKGGFDRSQSHSSPTIVAEKSVRPCTSHRDKK